MKLFGRTDKLKVSNWLRLGKQATLEVENADGSVSSVDGPELARVCDAGGRVVSTSATALSLTVADHGERVVLVNTNSTVANTFTLPAATGSGHKFTVINNIAQTQGTVVVACAGTDVMSGICVGVNSTAAGTNGNFLTTATSDKFTLNLTTTGGLKGDIIEAWDTAAGTYTVRAGINGSGTLATPFSAT